MNLRGTARARALAAIVAGLATFGGARAVAAEVLYDPPTGSRWIVETELRGEEIRPEGSTTSLVKTRAELTVEAKTADGFRMSWVQRGGSVEGNARSVALQRAYAGVLDNLVIRVSTDLSGKPLRIDNLDETKAAMRRAADALAPQFDAAAMSAFMQSFARSLLAASGDSVTPERVNLLVQSMTFSFDKRAEFGVEDGMTRRVSEKSATVFRGLEQNLTRIEARTIAVTPAR